MYISENIWSGRKIGTFVKITFYIDGKIIEINNEIKKLRNYPYNANFPVRYCSAHVPSPLAVLLFSFLLLPPTIPC